MGDLTSTDPKAAGDARPAAPQESPRRLEPLHLETEALLLRRFSVLDAPALFGYLSLPDTYLFEPGAPIGREEAEEIAAARASDERFVAVESKEEGRLVGHLYFSRLEPEEFLTWELGYIFDPGFRNRGWCTEASRRLIRYAFEELGAHRVVAFCNVRNAASVRVLEKSGLRREGCFRKKAFFRTDADGRPLWHDSYAYALLREEALGA